MSDSLTDVVVIRSVHKSRGADWRPRVILVHDFDRVHVPDLSAWHGIRVRARCGRTGVSAQNLRTSSRSSQHELSAWGS